MSWIQNNKVPAAILGLSAAGAAGLGYMLFSAYSDYSANLEQFNSLNGSLATLKSAPLAPTPENLALKQGLVKEFTDSADKLSLVLNKLQVEVKPTTDTEFQAKLKSKIAESRKLAGTLGVGLPAEYNLAFDRYTAELPKSAEMATELSGYLDAVDEIVNTVMKSGVKQVDMLERSELDSEKGESAKPAPRTAVRPGRPGAAAPAPAAVKMADRRQVRMMLTTDQAALQKLMSSLASPSEMPHFTVVRLLRIENERQEGPLRADLNILPPANPSGEGEAAAPAAAGASAPARAAAKPAPVDAIAVLGNERLRVFIELDLVSFLKPQTAATGTR